MTSHCREWQLRLCSLMLAPADSQPVRIHARISSVLPSIPKASFQYRILFDMGNGDNPKAFAGSTHTVPYHTLKFAWGEH